ncbi:MAG: phosphodiesterase [Paracoccaceae bacterium]
MLKFLVISDLHLMPEGQTSMTLDTAARLETCVAAINARYSDADFVVVAGDLADLGEEAAYRRLQTILGRLTIPAYVTLGNHDDRPTYLKVFGAHHADETGKINHVIDAKGTRVIVLDSSEPGLVHGVLTEAQVAWLTARLAEAADRPVIVVLHHNANALHIAADTIKLTDDALFIAALKSHPDVRQVIAGHVHLTSTAMYHGIPFTTLAGGHYSVSFNVNAPNAAFRALTGPGQMAVVLCEAHATTVLFEDFIDGNTVIAEIAD